MPPSGVPPNMGHFNSYRPIVPNMISRHDIPNILHGLRDQIPNTTRRDSVLRLMQIVFPQISRLDVDMSPMRLRWLRKCIGFESRCFQQSNSLQAYSSLVDMCINEISSSGILQIIFPHSFQQANITPVVKCDPCSGPSNIRIEMNPNLAVVDYEELRKDILELWDVVGQHHNIDKSPILWVNTRNTDLYYNILSMLEVSKMDKVNVQYNLPWQFIVAAEDMFNHFSKDKAGNSKKDYTAKLHEWRHEYNDKIKKLMTRWGYCCHSHLPYTPYTLYCYGNSLQHCIIKRDQRYMLYEDTYYLCLSCFNKQPGDEVVVDSKVGNHKITLKKDKFKESVNNEIEYERTVKCVKCTREVHHVCVGYNEELFPGQQFICSNCSMHIPGQLQTLYERYSPKSLPQSRLALSIENRLDNFFKKVGRKNPSFGNPNVTVRVINNSNRCWDVKPRIKNICCADRGRSPSPPGLCTSAADSMSRSPTSSTSSSNTKGWPSHFPFKSKSIIAFEEIGGHHVCFFAMFVHEYGSDCESPNSRHVLISYLDSVKLFQPAQLRTAVYKEIVLGYLRWVKEHGFTTAHIWSAPPQKGNDYIFFAHPPQQNFPTHEMLQRWYRDILDCGMSEGTIESYNTVADEIQIEHINDLISIPYFEDDLWPRALEEILEDAEKNGDRFPPAKSKKRDSRGQTINTDLIKGPQEMLSKYCIEKLNQKIKEHRREYFIIKLIDGVPDKPTSDPDPTFLCSFAETRDGILGFATLNHYECSSLRHSKYTSLLLLKHLHELIGSTFKCHLCKKEIHTRDAYQCSTCEKITICHKCLGDTGITNGSHISNGHNFVSLDITLKPDNPIPSGTRSPNAQDFWNMQDDAIEAIFEHARNCNIPPLPQPLPPDDKAKAGQKGCPEQWCSDAKEIIQHMAGCRCTHAIGCDDCQKYHTWRDRYDSAPRSTGL